MKIKFFAICVLLLIVSACSPTANEVVEVLEPTETLEIVPTSTLVPLPTETPIPQFILADYDFNEQIVEPELETGISLDDGASIIIPANSIEEPITVKIERNPEKINDLPPLESNVIQLSDFYNFVVDGNLTGPVDLVFPFDPSFINDKNGFLSVGYPEEDGWRYVPVIPDGDTVRIYTIDVGDPIIAWQFTPDDFSIEDVAICEPDIPLQILEIEDGYRVFGQLIPANDSYFGFERKPAANVEVTIDINLFGWRDEGEGNQFTVLTDEDGYFQQDLDPGLLYEGWNWVFAEAECEKWFAEESVISKGYAEYKVELEIESVESAEELSPETTEIIIPDDRVLLPDLTGESFEQAVETLEDLGFRYLWVDGASTYSLGDVYSQEPAGEEYYVPHRTTVVLHRTTEQDYCNLDGIWEGEMDGNTRKLNLKISITKIGDCNYTGFSDTGSLGWTCSFDMLHTERNEFYFYESGNGVWWLDGGYWFCGYMGDMKIENGIMILNESILLTKTN